MPLPPELAREAFAYLTTTGAVTGLPREIEIWFAAGDGAIHLISGGGRRARWVGNLLARPDAVLRVGDRTLRVRARLPLPPGTERDDAIARLHAKYGTQVTSSAEDWRRRAYIVALDPA
jgi:deazaflavin-dependent oxidoreductase (nitroreductase family)